VPQSKFAQGLDLRLQEHEEVIVVGLALPYCSESYRALEVPYCTVPLAFERDESRQITTQPRIWNAEPRWSSASFLEAESQR